MSVYSSNFAQNGLFWRLVAYTSAVGGNILAIGSLSGLALMRTEGIQFGWYFRNVGMKALAGGSVGAALMMLI